MSHEISSRILSDDFGQKQQSYCVKSELNPAKSRKSKYIEIAIENPSLIDHVPIKIFIYQLFSSDFPSTHLYSQGFFPPFSSSNLRVTGEYT